MRDSQMSTAISSFQAWAGRRTSRSESPTASFTTRTSKQYDSRQHNPSVGADWLGSVRRIVSSVSFALLSSPDISRLAIISCREVLSSVTWASSASFIGMPFHFSSFLGGSLEAMLTIRQLRWLLELRIGYELPRCQSGNHYGFNLKETGKNPLVVIPVSCPGLIQDSANRNSETYTDLSLPAPLNQLC